MEDRPMKRTPKITFFIVAVLILALAYTSFFGVYTNYGDRVDTIFRGAQDIRTGIDISGGIEVTFAPEDKNINPPDAQVDAMKDVIVRRMIANGITDTAVCMAAKAHLRKDRPLVISLASNDGLSANLKNIATLLSRKQVYFVPMEQDDPEKKPHSLVADFSLLPPTLEAAFEGRQYRKLFL